MRNKLIFVFILFFVFLAYFTQSFLAQKPKSHKVLDIIRADMFYVDINDNSKIDEGELFKLRDVYAFSNELNDFVLEQCNNLNISKTDYLKLGFVTQAWAVDNLKGKDIVITSIIEDNSKKYKYINAKFNGYDLSQFYLEQGLAFVNKNSDSEYLMYQNTKQMRNNIDEISKIDFVLLNTHSNIFHKLNCEFANSIHRAKLLPLKFSKNYIPCKNCFKKLNFAKYNVAKTFNVVLHKDFGEVELYFTNPLIYDKPDSSCSNEICKRLVNEINNTKISLDIALYGVGNMPKVYEALIDAKKRGVKIRAVVDYSSKMDELYPKTMDFIKDFNALTDKSEVIMHNKFFIFDDKKVLTGSANLSPSGLGGYSANTVIMINSDKISAYYKREFEQMYNSKFSTNKEALDKLNEGEISVYFSPKDNIKQVLLDKINGANDEILVSAFYLTNKEIINALIAARKRDVKVFIILDAVGANNFKDRVYLMRKSGISLIVENWGGKDHEKTIMVDKQILITGSLNFTKAGLNKNDENIVVIKNPHAAEFYRNYFFFLFNSIDKKFLKLIPRAESFDSVNSCKDGIDNNFDGKIDNDDLGCRN